MMITLGTLLAMELTSKLFWAGLWVIGIPLPLVFLGYMLFGSR